MRKAGALLSAVAGTNRRYSEFVETSAYHFPDKFGFFVVAKKVDGPRAWQQRSYRLDRLPEILKSLDGEPDTYISQASFAKPNRKVASFARVNVLWVDLDIYHVEHLRGFSPENIAWQLREACADRGIPPPSVIIDSGMGMYAKWYLEAPLPKKALSRWQLVQNTLCLKLMDFGADKRAKDPSRVLRVVGSTHRKSGRRVEVIWQNTTPTHGAGIDNGVATYSFDMLADDLLPMTREELRVLRAEREREKQAALNRETSTGNSLTLIQRRNTNGLRPFIPSQLAWDRFNDIAKLMEIRGWHAGAPDGQRDIPVFLAAAMMSQAVVFPRLADEIESIGRRIAPWWSTAELQSCVASVVARAGAAFKGEKHEFNGREVDPRYAFKTETLLTLLDVTPEEETQLTTIISKSEVRRRDAIRARQSRARAGASTREDYEAEAAGRRLRAQALRSEGKSWAEVGAVIGVSATAARLLASRADPRRSCPSVYMQVGDPIAVRLGSPVIKTGP
jgi:hypothetical protein